jgi:hypothetical protein
VDNKCFVEMFIAATALDLGLSKLMVIEIEVASATALRLLELESVKHRTTELFILHYTCPITTYSPSSTVNLC